MLATCLRGINKRVAVRYGIGIRESNRVLIRRPFTVGFERPNGQDILSTSGELDPRLLGRSCDAAKSGPVLNGCGREPNERQPEILYRPYLLHKLIQIDGLGQITICV